MNFFSYYVHVVRKRASQVASIVIWFVFFYFFWKLGDPFPMLSPKHGKHITNVWAYSQSHYKFMDPFPILSSKHVKHVTNVWAYFQSRYKFMDPFPILCLKYCKHMLPKYCSNKIMVCCTCITVTAYCFTISDQDTSNADIIENTHNAQNAKCNIQTSKLWVLSGKKASLANLHYTHFTSLSGEICIWLDKLSD